MNLANLRIGNKLRCAFAAVIAIYLAMSATSFWSNARLAQAEQWKQNSYDVQLTGGRLLESMLNMEAGARGYLLSGHDAFLMPWTNGLRDFASARDEALQLTADNPAQQGRLEQMTRRQEEFRQVEEALFAAPRQVSAGKLGCDVFALDFAAGKDKAAMAPFRVLAADFVSAERTLLAARTPETEVLRAISSAVQLFGTLLAVALGAVAQEILKQL